MYSREFDMGDADGYGVNSTYSYNMNDHPREFDFTFEEIERCFHESGSAGSCWYLSVNKDLGNGRTRQFYGIGIHVNSWLTMAKREIQRTRQGLPSQRYLAQRAKNTWWVNPKLCDPVIDSSKYSTAQSKNQNKMVA